MRVTHLRTVVVLAVLPFVARCGSTQSINLDEAGTQSLELDGAEGDLNNISAKPSVLIPGVLGELEIDARDGKVLFPLADANKPLVFANKQAFYEFVKLKLNAETWSKPNGDSGLRLKVRTYGTSYYGASTNGTLLPVTNNVVGIYLTGKFGYLTIGTTKVELRAKGDLPLASATQSFCNGANTWCMQASSGNNEYYAAANLYSWTKQTKGGRKQTCTGVWPFLSCSYSGWHFIDTAFDYFTPAPSCTRRLAGKYASGKNVTQVTSELWGFGLNTSGGPSAIPAEDGSGDLHSITETESSHLSRSANATIVVTGNLESGFDCQ